MKKRFLSLILIISMITALLTGINITAASADTISDIEREFAAYKQGDTIKLDDDGYAKIPVDIYVYYDYVSNGAAKPELGGTFTIIYAINTNTKRIGTDNDISIIKSMLKRGYIVVVADYKNDSKSSTPTIDWSVHKIRERTQKMEFFKDTKVFPKGAYCENIAVPAGYDVSLKNKFWSVDEHGTVGSMEKIVEVWNTDFKSVRGDLYVKWVNSAGEQKATSESAVWYNLTDESKQTYTQSPDGEYTKVKYTIAKDIHDIVNPDGTPIDLNQYINIAYPTNPDKEVPVMSMASSGTGNLSALFGASFRPQMNGFLFRGYAGAIYDYLYIPMARDDVYQFFEGSKKKGGKTDDALIYSLSVYNDKLVNTAAMRYLRNLALSEPSKFKFDINAFGAYGNSKGSWINYLATAECSEETDIGKHDSLEEAINERLCSLPMKRIHQGYKGTRYQIGETEKVNEIRGGEMQPYLTYKGKEISSAIQFVYTSCGGAEEDILPGNAPMFLSSNFGDELGSPYNTTYRLLSACKAMDVPTLHLDVATNHSFCNGNDLNYGVDSYVAFMDYAGYWLKKDPIKVVYTEPMNGTSDIKPGDTVLIKFGGTVTETEIEKISIKDSSDNILSGSWSSEFGNTEWTFTPQNLKQDTTYTVTIPDTFCGHNEVPMGEKYSFSFKTRKELKVESSSDNGTHFEYTVPDLTDASYVNSAKLRLNVTNDAANTALVYLTDSLTNNSGTLVDKINLKGSGVYEIDISDIALEKDKGDKLYFYIVQEKVKENKLVYHDDFSETKGKNYRSSYATDSLEPAPDPDKTPSYKLSIRAVKDNGSSYYENESPYYSNTTTLFTNSNLLNNGEPFTSDDYGRKFKISFKVYDTKSRSIFMSFSDNTSKFESYKINSAIEKSIVDRDSVSYGVKTKANEWTDVNFDYVVYDSEYGKFANGTKILTVTGTPDGDSLTPYYFADLKVTEEVTDIEFTADLIYLKNGTKPYIKNDPENTFEDTNGNKYQTYKDAAANSNSIKLLRNYTLKDADLADLSVHKDFTLDLNGYRIYSENTQAALIWAKSLNSEKTNITLKNGTVILKDTPIVSFKDSALAKAYNITIDNIDILTDKNASLTSYVSEKTSSLAISADFTIKNCNTYISDDNLTKNKSVIFAKGEKMLSLSYKVYGGTIKLDTERKVAVSDNLKYTAFYKENNKYTNMLITSPYFTPYGAYTTEEGEVYSFVKKDTSGEYTSYSLGESELATPYGEISELYQSEDSYPFVLFDADNKCIWGTSEFGNDNDDGSALIKARWIFDNGGNAGTIYLRRDYDYKETELFSEISFVFGDLVIDLGGNTFETQKGTQYPLYANAKKGTIDTNITVKNGSFVSGGTTILRYNVSGGSKNIRYTFDNVNFSVKENWKPQSYYASPFFCSLDWSGVPDNPPIANGYLTLNNCNLDFTGINKEKQIYVFDHASTNSNIALAAVMNGGSIKADTFTNISMYNLESLSTLAFGKSNTAYTNLIAPSGSTAPSDEIRDTDGRILSYKETTDGTNVIYTMFYDENAQERPSYISSVKTYDFEDGLVGNAAKRGNPKFSIISRKDSPFRLPESFGSNALAFDYTANTDTLYFNLLNSGKEITEGIIELKMDMLYRNDTESGRTHGICLGLSSSDTEEILWRINNSGTDVLTDNTNAWTQTSLDEDTWYTVKSVVDLDTDTYDLYVRESDSTGEYIPIVLGANTGAVIGNNPSQVYLKFHTASSLTQYLDNLKITVYEPVDIGAAVDDNNSLNITFIKKTELMMGDKIYIAVYFENELKELKQITVSNAKTYKSLSEDKFLYEGKIETENYDKVSVMIWGGDEKLKPLVKKCDLD